MIPDEGPGANPVRSPTPSPSLTVQPKKRWWRRLGLGRAKPSGPSTVEDVEKELGRARAAARWTDVGIRKWLGYGSLFVLAFQLVVADVAFFIYGYNNDWNIHETAINVWLAAVVVQLFILVRGIRDYLFPADESPHKDE